MKPYTFGERQADVDYQLRIGVYGIVYDSEKDKLLLVSPPNGSYLLPGGEKENQETDEETLQRESLEELGYQIEVGPHLGDAEDYFYSTHRKQYYHNPAYFYVIKKWEAVSEPLEDFNELEWMTVTEALKKLKRGSHQWAVEQWLKNQKK
ncbi:MAG: NUDIX domain-containing protein [Carnobacterium sp.]|uniref:NUDIX hydrolase n=1 Tax=Carnobacterium antarcticum TaxID=2126436 RepID=A0ABW4NNP9_9LACT|nr:MULTISPECIES: NUDIX domain-containing protein [unclassified Carnobacterium]ALV22577.1 Mutator mutT protein (7,8-dihydro-8-oxoguanine-triphosphatase) [Carnobacterium sp. CP1]QQP70488.1 NUDIX domain-containing protein [Carnobacterium sp. CS13]